ncbi:MAG: TonB family protein [Gammaproteobacteria bacterium]|tara:strand:+ start:179 stop:769 length:591 start_codon:yes stop_codon:yes gene_type:complete
MINLYLGFFLSLLGHSIILLMVLLDFSIFFPNKQTYEVIPVGFILEKKENYLINEVQKNFFSLKNLESNNFRDEKFLKSKEKIDTNDLLISAKQSLESLKKEKFKVTINIIKKKFIDLWDKPFVLNDDIKVSIKIKLAPSGEILSRTLIQSSGDNKFDDSAMKAVGKISFLKEISNLNREDFEKYFREVNLVFKSR